MVCWTLVKTQFRMPLNAEKTTLICGLNRLYDVVFGILRDYF